MEQVDTILTAAYEKNASDVHLVVGSAPVFRVDGSRDDLQRKPDLAQRRVEVEARHHDGAQEVLAVARLQRLELDRRALAGFAAEWTRVFVALVVPRTNDRVGDGHRLLRTEHGVGRGTIPPTAPDANHGLRSRERSGVSGGAE